MRRSARALVALSATTAIFVLCLWLPGKFRFSWEPAGASDRWAMALAFAGVIAGAFFTLINSPGDKEGKRSAGPASLLDAGPVSDPVSSLVCPNRKCRKKSLVVHSASRNRLFLVCTACSHTSCVVHDGERWLRILCGTTIVAEGAVMIAEYFNITPHDLWDVISALLESL
jgi:hypothetical protein